MDVTARLRGAYSFRRWSESFLVSIDSSGCSAVPWTAVRATAEGAVLAVAFFVVSRLIWEGSTVSFAVGISTAWAASAVSVAWLLWARARSTEAFWWAFGGGTALRAAVLAALVIWGWKRQGVSMEPLLLSYVFTLLAMLLTLEFRYLRLR